MFVSARFPRPHLPHPHVNVIHTLKSSRFTPICLHCLQYVAANSPLGTRVVAAVHLLAQPRRPANIVEYLCDL